jgi:small subunit ribosomal protein S6
MVTKVGKTITRKKGKLKKPLVVEDKELRDYEMVIIMNPELAEDKANTALEGIKKLISDRDGVVSEITHWGKRKLAYPIKHHSEGIYVFTRLQLHAAICKEIEAKLQISEDVLRHLLVRLHNLPKG